MVVPIDISRGVLMVAGLVLLWLTYRTYRDREKPVETSFAMLIGLLSATAFCLGVTAAEGWGGKLIWLHTNLGIPVALVYFSLDYYGVDLFTSRERTAALLVPAFLGSLGGSLLILGTPTQIAGTEAPMAMLADLPGGFYEAATTFDQVGYYYTVALIAIAITLVFRNVLRYEHLDTRLGLVIAFIGFWPWFGNFILPELAVAQSGQVGMAVLAGGYSTSAIVTTLVVGPLGLFESTPAAGNVGPERVLDSMDDAVFMVDDRDQILRVNAVACETFDVSESEAVGRGIDDVLDVQAVKLQRETQLPLETGDGRRKFKVTRSPVTDRWDEERGNVYVFRDVTQRQTRQQRLEVLNRVLRHNLRNNASSIIGRAELISDGGQEERFAEQIIDTTQDLMSAAERAREIERMMNATDADATADVESIANRVTGKIAEDYPTVEFTMALPDDAGAAVNSQVLETVLFNLVENGAKHNDADQPIVVISADYDGETLAIAVSDNGPGIPEHERSVLDTGQEDQLQHGSGLGLWAAYWGVTQMGGELTITDNDPRGSVVTIEVPAAEKPEQTEQSPILTA